MHIYNVKSVVVDKGSFEEKKIDIAIYIVRHFLYKFWVVEMLINMCSECTILIKISQNFEEKIWIVYM